MTNKPLLNELAREILKKAQVTNALADDGGVDEDWQPTQEELACFYAGFEYGLKYYLGAAAKVISDPAARDTHE